MEKTVFFWSQEIDGKMIFSDYWKALVLNFSGVESTVFFSAKKLMERLYLIILFELSMIFQDLGNMGFCAVVSKCIAISNTKYYAWVVTLSTPVNTELLIQLQSGFKRTISLNKY